MENKISEVRMELILYREDKDYSMGDARPLTRKIIELINSEGGGMIKVRIISSPDIIENDQK